MSLNIQIDAIHTDNIVTVAYVDLGAHGLTGNNPDAKVFTLLATDGCWIVLGSVKISAGTATETSFPTGTGVNIVATPTVTDHVGRKVSAKWTGTIAGTNPNAWATYKYFKADSVRLYTAGAVPTTMRFRNDDEDADIVVAESDDGTNWLQVGADQVKKWEIASFERVAQRQLKVASSGSGRLIGSPISAI